jgi:hypothetical protein
MRVRGEWEGTQTFARDPELKAYQRQLQLKFQVLEAKSKVVRLRLKTTLDWRYEAGWDRFGLNTTDLLTLPEEQSGLINWILRSGGVDLAQAATYLGQAPAETQSYLAPLIKQGFVQVLNLETIPHYQVQMAAIRSRHLPPKLAEPAAAAPKRRQPAVVERSLDTLLSERGRFWLGLAPLVVIFLAAQWQLFTGSESFSAPLSFIGVVIVAMLGGIFPVLLLQASRRRGDITPEVVYHRAGHPVFLIIIFGLSLTGVILHGLFIWEDLIMRGLALVMTAVIIGMTINTWRRGAFIPRFVVELRGGASADHPASLALTYNSVPLEAGVRLVFAGSDTEGQPIKTASHDIADLETLQSATIRLPALRANEIKVLAHQITPEGDAQPLPVTAELDTGGSTRQVQLMETGGQVTLPLDDQVIPLTLKLRVQMSQLHL